MKLVGLNGRVIKKPVFKYRIKWLEKSRSQLQFKVKLLLKSIWENEVVFEEFPVFGTRLKIDFLNATRMMAVEVQGPQHNKFNPFFHRNSRTLYHDSLTRDYNKTVWLEMNKIKLIEVFEKDLEDREKFFKLFI